MKKEKYRKILVLLLLVIIVMLAGIACTMANLKIKSNAIVDDYSDVFSNDKYSKPVYVYGVEVIEQNVSCGYAVIEMFGAWCGKNVTEESLFSDYGKVVTSTGKAFSNEMNKQFPEYRTTMHKYMKNTELIDAVYENLMDGVPVPFEWAALYGDDWTLHYSLITGMDIANDKVYIANPYGFEEAISLEEFLSRTSFEAFESMPWLLKMGFAVGIFEKNTIFTVE